MFSCSKWVHGYKELLPLKSSYWYHQTYHSNSLAMILCLLKSFWIKLVSLIDLQACSSFCVNGLSQVWWLNDLNCLLQKSRASSTASNPSNDVSPSAATPSPLTRLQTSHALSMLHRLVAETDSKSVAFTEEVWLYSLMPGSCIHVHSKLKVWFCAD